MTWTAPAVPDPDGPMTGDDRPMLIAYLAAQRSALLATCAGLSGEQLALRAVPPSTLSLLGLVRHMAKVERIWFRERLAGEQLDPMYSDGRRDADIDDTDPADAAADLARLVEEIRLAEEIVAGRSLDEVFDHRGEQMSVRFLHLHLIQEYARHAGHADLLRQCIDGTTAT